MKMKNKKQVKQVSINQKKGGFSFLTLFLWLQFLLTIALLVLGVVTLFQFQLLSYFQLLLGVTLIVMGINNIFVFKRKNVTLLYLGIGIFILILYILKLVM